LSPAEVRAARFPRPARGADGYDADQVDEFLAAVADALAGRRQVHPDQVRAVVFRRAASGQRGYDPRPVDEFLAGVEHQLRIGYVPPTALRTGADLLAVALPRGPRGYDPDEVAAFLARAAAALDGRLRMTANEVRNTRFSTTSGLRRGYQVRPVDALLDELEQELRARGRWR
jgi:DivIVA domain-containing protein